MLNIVFVDRASLPVAVPPLPLPHHWAEFDTTSPAEITARCIDADVIVSNKVMLDANTIAALPRLKLIAVAATGINHIDLAAAKARGIAVCNIRGYADATVPEHALMLMLALLRNLPAYKRDMVDGKWQQSPNFCHFGAPVRDLNGRTLLIVGAGSLGQGTAKLARAFGMQVLFAEHKGASAVRTGYVDFQAGLAQADVISLHCPLTTTTRNLLSTTEFGWMKRDAVLINTARGGIVDEVALLAALRAGTLGGAGIDVLHEEPPRQGNPLLEAGLANLIVTPHVGWASFEAMSQLATQLIGNIEAWAAGAPRNLL
ncbi:D-2-hydroxyacid dehydrogenase [Chitinimonas sp. BJB300]|uniref:D-2-hydroxyacid dehydrogenase n=1 Tax=Chitinimonas sp. BJB300 TaxID=1559339 RepID=UPI000C0DA5B0|nr:D-2-hydroxyacid dehydrogenase [Chitinimonas sp. BJB300]PHV12065.1 glycerate dehydrogenase [Chitinimonas sp. BJB300]TSJ87330.1 D-2-hydroxyacid dehydrogenase [Chitinimonas sp. BJB300]